MGNLPLLPLLAPTLAVDEVRAAAREDRLLAGLAAAGPTLVAFSGGVDSTYVAWAARQALGDRALAVTALSESFPRGRVVEVRELARSIGIAHETITSEETADQRYLANQPDRCYWCKSELYVKLGEIAHARGFAVLADGTNADDLGDFRPGRRAAGEGGVHSPLVEAGLGKDEVRWLSRRAGLATWHIPASPCLSSRVPYGTRIDAAVLAGVDRAEEAVRALGLREFRVRHLGRRARLEVAAVELAAAREPATARALVAAIRAAGYAEVEIDPEPFRSGRLNDAMRSGT